MEHWGLITYREVALLFDPKQHSIKDKFHVARVVAHELAHMVIGPNYNLSPSSSRKLVLAFAVVWQRGHDGMVG